jgi:alpha,alpha-trehalase
MPLIDSPESIIVQFNELLRQKALVSPEEWKSILLKFVKERFGTAGEDMVECSPNPASACARPMTWNDELLASMWTLCRKAYSSQSGSNCIRSTLIPAPYPFVIPGERFRESYYWDSYWILRGLLAQDDEVSDVALVRWNLED